MRITAYNQDVRLLSSEPFGWFAPPESTRSWEPGDAAVIRAKRGRRKPKTDRA
jgi:hypothetical protein